MKKIFMILAAIAMVCTVSCKKDNNKKDKKDDTSTTSAFAVDGNFDEWKASGIATATVPEGLDKYTHMMVMKAAGDDDNIYLYFEYELEEDEEGNVQAAAPFDLFFNSDGNAGTGFISWIWAKDNTGWDYLLETENGILASSTAIVGEINDMRKYKPEKRDDGTLGCYDAATGDQIDGWDSDHAALMTAQKDAPMVSVDIKGKIANGIAIFEMSVPRGSVDANKKGNIGISCTISNAAWTTMGILPIDAESTGVAGMLQVALP